VAAGASSGLQAECGLRSWLAGSRSNDTFHRQDLEPLSLQVRAGRSGRAHAPHWIATAHLLECDNSGNADAGAQRGLPRMPQRLLHWKQRSASPI